MNIWSGEANWSQIKSLVTISVKYDYDKIRAPNITFEHSWKMKKLELPSKLCHQRSARQILLRSLSETIRQKFRQVSDFSYLGSVYCIVCNQNVRARDTFGISWRFFQYEILKCKPMRVPNCLGSTLKSCVKLGRSKMEVIYLLTRVIIVLSNFVKIEKLKLIQNLTIALFKWNQSEIIYSTF